MKFYLSAIGAVGFGLLGTLTLDEYTYIPLGFLALSAVCFALMTHYDKQGDE